MKVLIIEDESIAVQRLTEMLHAIDPAIDIVNTIDGVDASVRFLEKLPELDLVFMDIELGDGQSFDIFEKIKIDAPVIFITAYQEHTLKAFKQNSVDYLLKPLNRAELESAITKYKRIHGEPKLQLQASIVDYLKVAKINGMSPHRQRFLAKAGTRLISTPVENIAYFYTKDRFQYIKTMTNQDLLIDKRLDDIEAEVEAARFFRANRQFILNYKNIEKVHAWFSGKLKVQVSPMPYEDIIVSRLKAADFKKWLGE
jgi:two-component system, LytTR family, response regulator LytT